MLWRAAALSLLGLPLAAGAQAVAPQADVTVAEPYRVSITVRSGQQSIFDIAGSADRISARDIRLDQAQVQLSESLAGVPGLLIRDRQNFAQDLQLSIRGFGARSTFGVRGVRLYVDRIPATLPDGQGQTSNIDLGSADRVEVLRGPFSALYGNSSGGVVQVFTEDGSGPPRVEAGSYFGAHDTTRTGAKISGSNDRISYVLSGSHFQTDGWREHSRADRDLFNAKLGFDLGGGDKITLVGNYVNVKAQDPGGLDAAQVQADPRQSLLGEMYNTHKNVEQTQFGLTWDKHVGSDSRLQLMAYGGRRNMEQYLSVPPAPQANPTHSGGVVGFVRDYYGLDARWTTKTELAARPFEWTAGLAWDSLRENRAGHENFVGAELGRRGLLRRDERNTVRSLDPYAQASWQLASRWRLDAGVRRSRVRFSSRDHYIVGPNGDDSYAARYVKWLPTAALRFEPNERWALYGAVGRGYETPTLNELAYQAGAGGVNTDLRPSSNLSYELGVKGFVGGGWLTAALFQTNTKDEIVTLANMGGRTTFQNAGRTRRRGFELSWDHQTSSYWRTQLAYTYLDARYRSDFCSPAPCSPATLVASGNRIPGIPAHALYAAFGWMPPQGWHAGTELRVLSRVYANDFNTASAAGHATVALHAGYTHRVGPWELNAFARVDNVLDRHVIGSVIVNDGNGRYFEPSPGRVWGIGLNASYRF